MSNGKLVPLKEAAELFFPYGGVTKSTLRLAISRGELSYAHLGNKFFVSEADISNWLEKCRVPAKEQVATGSTTKANS